VNVDQHRGGAPLARQAYLRVALQIRIQRNDEILARTGFDTLVLLLLDDPADGVDFTAGAGSPKSVS
jgi:hypothetical protein